MEIIEENKQLIEETERILGIVKTQHDDLIKDYGKEDFRTKFVGLSGNIFHTMLLDFAAVSMTICIPEWWEKHYKRKPSAGDISAVQNHGKFTKHAFLVFYFSKVETMIRKSLNLVSSGFDPTGVQSFKVVYDEYLKELNLETEIPLFDLMRLLRNAVHNNGIFIHPRGRDREITWDSKTYQFKHQQLIDFISTEFLFYIYEEMIHSVNRIVRADRFNSMKSIEDKFH
ncbi:hypothetical protein [Ekhidna sp.]|uniref:hypothetical protein n=1 Tax=Ekhidna sp. TaxID=2608089 RepID=UPI003C7CDEFC